MSLNEKSIIEKITNTEQARHLSGLLQSGKSTFWMQIFHQNNYRQSNESLLQTVIYKSYIYQLYLKFNFSLDPILSTILIHCWKDAGVFQNYTQATLYTFQKWVLNFCSKFEETRFLLFLENLKANLYFDIHHWTSSHCNNSAYTHCGYL